MKHSILFLTILPALLSAQSMEQYNWSGGPGVLGPDYFFGSTFLESTGIDWSSSPGELLLLSDSSMAADSGTLISSLVWIPMGTDWEILWGDIIWYGYEPDGTDIAFQLRTGMTPGSMGEWTAPITESETYLGEMLPDTVLLLQYRAVLSADEPTTPPPAIYHVIIEGWYPGDIAEGAGLLTGNATLRMGSNPSVGAVTGWLMLGEPEEVRLAVYDTSGRLITEIFRCELPGGEHSFHRELATPGVYLLVLETVRGSDTMRATVTTE